MDCADVILPFMSPIIKRSWILVDIFLYHCSSLQVECECCFCWLVYCRYKCVFERVNTMCMFSRYSVSVKATIFQHVLFYERTKRSVNVTWSCGRCVWCMLVSAFSFSRSRTLPITHHFVGGKMLEHRRYNVVLIIQQLPACDWWHGPTSVTKAGEPISRGERSRLSQSGLNKSVFCIRVWLINLVNQLCETSTIQDFVCCAVFW